MTAAALEGAALAECLAQGRASLAQRFFAKAAKIIDTPWQIAAGNDLRHPRLRQHQSTIGRFMNWYIGRVHHAGASDPTVASAFLRVANLIEPPTKLLVSTMMLKVMRGNLRRRRNPPRVLPSAACKAPNNVVETVD